jgi:hypothetical protein
VPSIDSGNSDEELLYFVMQFFCATAIMEWTEDSNRSLQNFEQHLQGSYLSDLPLVVEGSSDGAPIQPPVHDMCR